jgi:hypothetical protein
MSAFAYLARFTRGGDGRILVEFVDLPCVATDGKDDREAMEEAMDALGSDLSIVCPAGKRSPRLQRRSVVSAWCPCRFGWRRNWRSTWRCAISKSTTPN